MISSVNHGGNINQLKAQYFEAQRNEDEAAMSKAKNEAMKIMNEEKQPEDTVEISQEALIKYQNTNK